MKETVTVKFRTLTPMFLAGAEQAEAELRIPSVKGALRFWYRAVDPDYRQKEGVLFGSGGEGGGQSRFLMRLESKPNLKSEEWENGKSGGGLSYLSFPFDQDQNQKRKFISPDGEFALSLYRRPSAGAEERERDWKGWMAAVWLLGHVGSLGSRGRRGFGSLELKAVEPGPGAPVEITNLPLAHGKGTPQDWMNAFQNGLHQIQEWFEGSPVADHTVLDRESTFHLHSKGYAHWREAMNEMGHHLKTFRESPIGKKKRGTRKWQVGAALGLPLIIKDEKQGDWTFAPEDGNRQASPVWMRVVKIGGYYYPFISVLSTFPSLTAVCKEKKGEGRTLSVPIAETLHHFRDYLEKKGYEEVVRV